MKHPRLLLSVPLSLGLLTSSLTAQTNNYFGTTGTLSGSVWSTNVAGPYTSALNTTGGAIINFGNATTAITGGTITVAGINATANATITTAGGTISNFNNGVIPIDVASGITLNFGSQTFTTSGTAGYIKNGAGTLSLAGSAWGGGFTLNAGTVAVGGVNAMGGAASNTLTINGGTIRSTNTTARDLTGKYAGGITIGGDFTLGDATNNGLLTFTNNMALGAANRSIAVNSAVSMGGIISGSAGVGLTKTGTGALTLGGVNTFTGALNINGGTLVVNVAGNGTNSALGSVSNTRTITVGTGATLRADVGNIFNASFATAASSLPALNITGTMTNGGTATNSALGNITLNGGTLAATVGSPAGTASGQGFGSWNLNGTVTSTGTSTISSSTGAGIPITLNATNGLSSPATNFDVTSGTLTVSAILGQVTRAGNETVGSLTKSGTGTLALSGANTYTGVTTLSGGTLSLRTSLIAAGSGAITFDTGGAVNATVDFGGAGALAGNLANNITVTAGSAGTNKLSSSATAAGLVLTGIITANDNLTIENTSGYADSNTLGYAVMGTGTSTVAAGKTITISNTNTGRTFVGTTGANSITGTGSLAIGGTGSGFILVNGQNTYSGGFTLSGTGTVLSAETSTTGSPGAVTAGPWGTGTLKLGTGFTRSTTVADSTYGNVISLDGNTTFVTGSGERNLTFTGPGTLTGNRTLTVNVGATVTTRSVTFSGDIGEDVAGRTLTKAGTGVLTLSGNNNYSGGTTINTGRLQFATQGSLYNNNPLSWTPANINVLSGATLGLNVDSAGTSGFTASNLNTLLANISVANSATEGLQSGAILALDTSTASGATFTQGNPITNSTGVNGGAIGFNKIGAGTLVFDQTNTYSGITTISAGVLRITNGSALGSTSSGTTQSGASALELDGSGGDVIVAAEALTINGGALRNIAGNNTYGGTVTMAAQSRINSDSGTLTLNNPTTAVTGAFTLVVGGAGNITIATPMTNGIGGVSKDGTGTLTLSAANSYSGTTAINEGTIAFTTVNQSLTGGLTFGSPISTTTVGSLDLSAASATFAGATVVQTNTASANTISIGSSQTLATNGNVTIGANAAGQTTNLTVSGAGSWTITNAAASGTFQVGGAIGASNSSAVIADLSGLAIFNANLSGATSLFRVTDASTFSTGSVTQTLKLAATSTITATTLGIGDLSGGGGGVVNAKVLSLGTGVNTINADSIRIGEASNQRGSGIINFQDSSLGSLIIRSQAGLTGTANLTMVNSSNNGATQHDAKLLLAGHTVDISLNNIVMAAKSNSGTTGGADALITFDTGTFSANTTAMAARTGAIPSTTATSGTITIGGGTASLGAVTMAVNTSTSAVVNPGVTNATLNISGGTVTASSIMMANAVNTGVNKTANANINITGGSLTLAGNITRTGGTGTENATLTLNGGTLDMAGFTIGSANTISLAAQSGTLQNIGQINSGATSLNKTTAGTLLLAGNNTYTGGTTVSAGTLTAGNANALGSDNVTVAPSATLNLGGFAVTNTIINQGGTISGANNYTGPQTLTGSSTYSGTIASTVAVNSGGTILGNATFTGIVTINNGGTAKGTGNFSGGLVINTGGTLSPGNSPGTIPAGDTTWNGGSTYLWEVNNTSGTAGSEPGWDLLAITGTLDLTNASSSNQITIDVTSLGLNNLAGNAVNFDINAQNQAWTIVSTTVGINGFASDKFIVDISGFSNDTTRGWAWSVQQSGNNLNLVYVPEPSTYAALAGLTVLGLAFLRRRKA